MTENKDNNYLDNVLDALDCVQADNDNVKNHLEAIKLDKAKVVDNNRPMGKLRSINTKIKRFLNKRKYRTRSITRSRVSSHLRVKNRINIKIFGKKMSFSKSSMFKYLAILFFIGIVLGTFLVVGIFAWYSKDLPAPDKIVRKEGFATKIFDRNDTLLYEVYVDEKRIPATWENIPERLKQATISIEDKDFYKHKGFDPLGYLRIVQNLVFKGRMIGGSTLTQQIVKNVLLTSERTLSRKIKELVLAIQIERKYNKDEILTIYLNEAPYGGAAWGVVTAAEMYFGKEVKDLNLVESAILAGMPQAPSIYSPYGSNPDAFKYRTQDVLRRMREDGFINKSEEAQAIADLDNVVFMPQGGSIMAPHFVMYVKKILEERYGENIVEKGGLTVKTTLDYELHKQIQEIVTEEIAKVEETHKITNGSAVVIDPNTGEILSMVGSKNYFAEDYDGKVNVSTALRQPGSSIKPVTYAQALREGFTPESMIMDVKTEFPGVEAAHPYVPANYNGKFNGPVSLRNALGSSLNIPAVKLLALVGVEDMMQLGYDMGISTFEPTTDNTNRLGLSVTLGGGEVSLLELTTAYSAFANGGKKVDPISILEVKDQNGNILEKYKEMEGKQVLEEGIAYLISHILSDDNARLLSFGANSLLNINWRSIAVKTGTTDDLRDNWTIGWSPQVIVGVWVGNNDNSKMGSVASGVSGASPIWRRSILAALEGKPVMEFTKPDVIENVKVDQVTGYPAHNGFAEKDAVVIKGTLPSDKDPFHTMLKVCKSDEGKLATPAVVARRDYNEKEFFVFFESDPLFGDDNNHWQKGISEWMQAQEDSRYHPPTEFCDEDTKVGIRIEEPRNESKVGNKFKIKTYVGVSNYDDVKEVKFYANGDEIGKRNQLPYEIDAELSDGTYELTAKVWLKNGDTEEAKVKIGVNVDWDWVEPTPTPKSTTTPKATVKPEETPEATESGSIIDSNNNS